MTHRVVLFGQRKSVFHKIVLSPKKSSSPKICRAKIVESRDSIMELHRGCRRLALSVVRVHLLLAPLLNSLWALPGHHFLSLSFDFHTVLREARSSLRTACFGDPTIHSDQQRSPICILLGPRGMCNHGRVNECLEIDHINNSYIDVRMENRMLVVKRQSAAVLDSCEPFTIGAG